MVFFNPSLIIHVFKFRGSPVRTHIYCHVHFVSVKINLIDLAKFRELWWALLSDIQGFVHTANNAFKYTDIAIDCLDGLI